MTWVGQSGLSEFGVAFVVTLAEEHRSLASLVSITRNIPIFFLF